MIPAQSGQTIQIPVKSFLNQSFTHQPKIQLPDSKTFASDRPYLSQIIDRLASMGDR